jgi:uncharacterized damage-inducible protein DinB
MNRADEVRDLFGFNRWANHALLDAAATLSDEQYGRDLGSSFPSVRATLEHMGQAEWIWLRRLLGASPPAPPSGWASIVLAELRARWEEVEREQAAYLAQLTEPALDATLSYRTLSGEPYTSHRWQVLRHVVNHSTYHRGQVTTMLRQLGVTPPSTDLIRYYRLAAEAVLTAPAG